jgi:hypothetical protein
MTSYHAAGQRPRAECGQSEVDPPCVEPIERQGNITAAVRMKMLCHGLSIDTIELYERNMNDELALRLVHGELPVGS